MRGKEFPIAQADESLRGAIESVEWGKSFVLDAWTDLQEGMTAKLHDLIVDRYPDFQDLNKVDQKKLVGLVYWQISKTAEHLSDIDGDHMDAYFGAYVNNWVNEGEEK